jgi:hypothetical protein
MTEALEKAYASNTETPLITLEFLHSALSGGALRLVQGYYDIEATLEDASTVTFSASGIGVELPANSVEGKQELKLQIDNVSNLVWTEIKAIVTANRTTQERVTCKYRPFLESDLSAPAGATYSLNVTRAIVNRNQANIMATYVPVPAISYPSKRYYSSIYPGVKYV